jgi:hypothetical protein
LNVFPTIRPDAGEGKPGLEVLSGVFTSTNGAWTVPVEIDTAGNPTMANPTATGTFKQGVNNYHSAKLGLYSGASGTMSEVLFGGISLQYLDPTTHSIVTDDNLPFVNDITSVDIDAAGNYTQNYLGEFPELFDLAGNRLRFGADAEFLPADGLPTFDNGVIKRDQLKSRTVLGYIFGGIVANAAQTRVSPNTLSAASNQIFQVVYVPVPEPASWLLAACGLVLLTAVARIRRRGETHPPASDYAASWRSGDCAATRCIVPSTPCNTSKPAPTNPYISQS